jgi:hypothetical protein
MLQHFVGLAKGVQLLVIKFERFLNTLLCGPYIDEVQDNSARNNQEKQLPGYQKSHNSQK